MVGPVPHTVRRVVACARAAKASFLKRDIDGDGFSDKADDFPLNRSRH